MNAKFAAGVRSLLLKISLEDPFQNFEIKRKKLIKDALASNEIEKSFSKYCFPKIDSIIIPI
jgi:hypothetical protein